MNINVRLVVPLCANWSKASS